MAWPSRISPSGLAPRQEACLSSMSSTKPRRSQDGLQDCFRQNLNASRKAGPAASWTRPRWSPSTPAAAVVPLAASRETGPPSSGFMDTEEHYSWGCFRTSPRT
ncbi:hypothetical protein BU16DRAFT_384289 [Lophium mytilinum]|uniref:Uncharacterized protein n=1 Tax=Lophium mytilinum TaxID=390894 RepID=A0A6A6QU19_9PEZI|nr:hypothetical protein BU16DRAFT_384289 [Lophium mytilinum]